MNKLMKRLEDEKSAYLEELRKKKEIADADFSNEKGMKKRKAEKFIQKYDERVADAEVFFEHDEYEAFMNAKDNQEANEVFHSFCDKYNGYFRSRRNKVLFSIRENFVLEQKGVGLRSTRENDFVKARENRELHNQISSSSDHDGGVVGYRRL